MDLDDQELFFTQVKNKLYKCSELKELRKKFAKVISNTENPQEKKEYLQRINLIDEELNELER